MAVIRSAVASITPKCEAQSSELRLCWCNRESIGDQSIDHRRIDHLPRGESLPIALQKGLSYIRPTRWMRMTRS